MRFPNSPCVETPYIFEWSSNKLGPEELERAGGHHRICKCPFCFFSFREGPFSFTADSSLFGLKTVSNHSLAWVAEAEAAFLDLFGFPSFPCAPRRNCAPFVDSRPSVIGLSHFGRGEGEWSVGLKESPPLPSCDATVGELAEQTFIPGDAHYQSLGDKATEALRTFLYEGSLTLKK